MPKPTTLDLLGQHAPITDVLFQVERAACADPQVSEAMKLSGQDVEHDNLRVRFLSKRVAYEVTLVLDARPWRVDDVIEGEAIA